MVNRVELKQKEALYQYRWKPAREAAEEAVEKMDGWAKLAEPIDIVQADLREVFPELMARLRTELSDGILSVTRTVAQSYAAPDGSERIQHNSVREVVLRTSAGWFFRGRYLGKRIRAAQRKLHMGAQALKADSSGEAIAGARKEFRDAREVVSECLEMQSSLEELNRQDVWQGVAKWAREEMTTPGKFRVRKTELCRDFGFYEETFPLPAISSNEMQSAGQSVLARWPTI